LDHNCGIRTDNSVECWGRDHFGQVANTPAGSFQSVSAGGHHTCGIKTDGVVECWGSNDHNESTPPSGSFLSVSTGEEHACGIKSDGSVECWGNNDDGQASPPSSIFLSVSAGGFHTCGLTAAGIECWGRNDDGQTIVPNPATSDIGSSASNPGVSCLDIQTQGGSSGDGTYWIQLDPQDPAFEAWCDMTTDGRGWMLATVNGMDGRPATWTGNDYPRPGAAFYGDLATAVSDVVSIKAGGASASNYSLNAAHLFPNSNHEVLIYLGGATADYITATLPSSCNFFDGSTWCEEDTTGYFSVYHSNGNVLSSNAQACTTAHQNGSYSSDEYNEFGLHLLNGPENAPAHHCNTSSGHAVQNQIGRIYATLESDGTNNHWSDAALNHWNTPDATATRVPTPAFLLLR
jgi:hypothetical protein